MAININPEDLENIAQLIQDSTDPTAKGREKRKRSVESILLYDWQKMSEKEKEEAAASVGLPVDEVDNRLRERSVETRMEFNVEGNPKKTKFLQRSAQAMIDEFGGKDLEDNRRFDRDIKLFEKAYGKENADKLVSLLAPKIDSNVSAPEGSKSTMVGPGDLIPSEEELMKKDKEMLEKKLMNDPGVQAFMNYIMPSSSEADQEVTEDEEDETEVVETKKSSSDPFGGSSKKDKEEEVETASSTPMFMTEVDPFGPEEMIMGSEGSESADPGGPDPIEGDMPEIVLTPKDEKKEKGRGKQKIKDFFKKFKRKNKKKKNRGNDMDMPEFDPADEMTKYLKDGGKLVGDQYKIDMNKDGKISEADFKMMKEGGRMKYMGGGMMKPFMQYLMGGKTNKYK
tara:strand:- start:707 stop:1897 length:1191 start_codon:yes stop_codon:yes gene_type:complete